MDIRAYDSIIIGAGAAGMHCAAIAAQRTRKVLLLDHAKAAGEKIRISGGGRCNFTNLYCGPQNFISQNPHFCKSALAGFGPQDFIKLVEQSDISWFEKTLGQLFCQQHSGQIVQMLLNRCLDNGVELRLQTKILDVKNSKSGFNLSTSIGHFKTKSLIIATGALSIPKMGATGFGYDIARQFGLNIITPRPALVPLQVSHVFKQPVSQLAGLSLIAEVSCGSHSFTEAILFTHRGVSGPAILQISSYWASEQAITVNLAPGVDMLSTAKAARTKHPKQSPAKFMAGILPNKLAQIIAATISHQRLADMSDNHLQQMTDKVQRWSFVPEGTLGFRIAEVTAGGVDTKALSSKTMEAKSVPGLYFIGEVVDVTGHLGGHNFQWAWASANACARAL